MHCKETYVAFQCVILFPLLTSYCIAEWVGQGEVGGVAHRVTCTWWLLGLAVTAPGVGSGRSILALAAWTGLENATFTL